MIYVTDILSKEEVKYQQDSIDALTKNKTTKLIINAFIMSLLFKREDTSYHILLFNANINKKNILSQYQ